IDRIRTKKAEEQMPMNTGINDEQLFADIDRESRGEGDDGENAGNRMPEEGAPVDDAIGNVEGASGYREEGGFGRSDRGGDRDDGRGGRRRRGRRGGRRRGGEGRGEGGGRFGGERGGGGRSEIYEQNGYSAGGGEGEAPMRAEGGAGEENFNRG